MKNFLGLVIASLFFNACTKTEIIPNRPPNAFTVTQTLKPDGVTIELNWTKAKDPDGDAVSYAIVLKDTIAKNISNTTFTITGLDFNYNQAAKIIASDPKGLKTEATFTATTKAVVYATIPDPAFEKALVVAQIDKDGLVNGKMNAEDAKKVTKLEITDKGIKSLMGIEYFVDLQLLSCNTNKLTVLNVSKNTALEKLSCNENQLTTLDVSKNTALTRLQCHSNQLTTLDFSKNTALKYLLCNSNQLTTLDFSKNTALNWLFCVNNKLTTLDLSKTETLIEIMCASNQLTTLDLSKNEALEYIDCGYNELTKLDLSKNEAVQLLFCSNNKLTTLDLSRNTVLRILQCQSNQLTTLEVSKNAVLHWLFCNNNKLTTLDLSKNKALDALICESNKIKTICVVDVAKATANNSWSKDASAIYAICK